MPPTGHVPSGSVHTPRVYPQEKPKTGHAASGQGHPQLNKPPVSFGPGGLCAPDRGYDRRDHLPPRSDEARAPSIHAGQRRWLPISTKSNQFVKASSWRSKSDRKPRIATVFPNRIAELRQARPVTQHELSRALGLSDRHLRRIERGEIAPDAGALSQLAKALRVGVGELYRCEKGTT